MANKIYLSPSNQTCNVGCYHGIYKNECEMAEAIAACAKEYLERNYECEVMIARRELNMQKRIEEAREWESTVYLPIHTNAFNGTVSGVDGYFSPSNDDSEDFALALVNAIKSISNRYHNCKAGTYYECTRPTWCTHAYLEVDYHDNKEACEWLMSNPSLIGEKIGEAIAVYKKISERKYEITEEEKQEIEQILNPEEIKMEEKSKTSTSYFVGKAFDSKEEAIEFSNALNVIGFNASILPIEAYESTEDSDDESDGSVIIENDELEERGLEVGDMVQLNSDAEDLNRHTRFASFIYGRYLYVRAINGDRITVSTVPTGAVTGVVDISSIDSILYKED